MKKLVLFLMLGLSFLIGADTFVVNKKNCVYLDNQEHITKKDVPCVAFTISDEFNHPRLKSKECL